MAQKNFDFMKSEKLKFGGEELIGKRKSQRPLSVKSPMHLVLKTEEGKFFNPTNMRLKSLVFEMASKFNIRIYEYAVNWTHIHFAIKIKSRQDYVKFIRAITSKLAMAIRKVTRLQTKLFTLRPFTRIVSWGRDFSNLVNYIWDNQAEAHGKRRKKKAAAGFRKNKREKTSKNSRKRMRGEGSFSSP
jgi:REP element-mobilizing transposase RayT